ncbi:MAG: hypothetical protein GWP10_09870 [Nitrospiraceae bacterium]|nr:hypothetical protein [Nitrospiraceae bacterium]
MTTFASGAQSQTAYIAETTWGTTPGTPQTILLPLTGNTLKRNKDALTDNTLRSDRQIQSVRTGMKRVTGDLSFAFRFGDFDSFLESALMSTWGSGTALQALTVGSTAKSFTIEKGFTDVARYHPYTGCMVKTFTLSVKPNAIVEGSFSLIGKDMTPSATPLTASPTAASSNVPFDSFTGSIYEGGTGTGDAIAIVTGIDLTLENNSNSLDVLLSDTIAGIVAGRSTLTGTMSAYFEDATLLDKFFNETESSIVFTLTDPDSNSYTFTVPALKYTGGDPDISGEGPITLPMPFQAFYDSVSGTNFQIEKTV